MERTILSTKLFVPLIRKNSVVRDRLIKKIEAGAEQYGKLALISAPAGYGKTTLVTNWLKMTDRNIIWLSLDNKDNDPQIFYSYLMAALQNINSSIGHDAKNFFESPQYPTPETMSTLLINYIVAASLPCVIILDDYHVISNDFIHRTVEFIIESSPPMLFTVILSRQDPPFSLSKLRVRSQLTEIRTDDLRFTAEEAGKFLNKTMELSLSAAHIASLKNKTEGWAAGLQLAALSIKGQENHRIEEIIRRFDGNNRYVVDYFYEEILHSQKDEIKQFLCNIAILSRFCAPLCDVLTNRNDSHGILSSLEEADLFLIPLDDEHRWYRFHNLFAEYLQTETDADEKAALNRKAAEWLEKNGFQAEAIDHALTGKDTENSVRLIRDQLSYSALNGEFYNLIHWLDALTDNVIRSDAQLCSYKAWAHFLIGEMEKANYYVLAYKTVLDADPLSSGRIKGVEACLAISCDDKATIQLACGALSLIDDKELIMRVLILVALAHAQRNIGNLDESTRAFQEALSICSDFGFTLPYCSVSMELAYNFYYQGHLQAAIQFCKDFLYGESRFGSEPLPAIDLLNIPLGYFYLETNELELAEECIQKGIKASSKISISKIFGGNAELVLAKIRFIQGKRKEALKILSKCLEEAAAAGLPVTALRFSAALAEIQFNSGNAPWVENWIKENRLSIDGEIISSKETIYLVYIRLLISKKRWEDAHTLLKKMEDNSRKNQKNSTLIIILVLCAMLHSERDSIPDAKIALAEAVSIAAGENYRRSFLNEGEKIFHLLPLVRDKAPDFVDSLMEDHKASVLRGSLRGNKKKASFYPFGKDNYLLEQLSERELEILELVSSGLSNIHIATRLYISEGTVKWHLNRVFAKLGVKNRLQVINRARELNLLCK